MMIRVIIIIIIIILLYHELKIVNFGLINRLSHNWL